MSHYALVTMVIKDDEKLAQYLAVGGPAVAKHGGKPIAGGPASAALQQPHGTTRGVVLEFDAPEQINAWLEDPELADVHALRDAATDVTILSLPQIA